MKAIRSQEAMQRSVATSPVYGRRQNELYRRTRLMRAAIRARSADRLFPLIMEECDSFREVCETTDPPLDYLTPTSRAILDEVRTINREAGRPIAAYTHDAGAHVHVFTTQPRARSIARRLGAIPGVGETRTLRPGAGVRWIRTARSKDPSVELRGR
ncbi:diphosphomevalonate decarboxylase [mine drainage metagenome]|uniref:Diphosphomevalonate decarboxylase n=1 Tax=mine drainage metagenome TaxID=410659 RepID=T1A6B8_9ZZZZ